MPESIYGHHFDIRIWEEGLSMSELQEQRRQATDIFFSDRHVKKELTGQSSVRPPTWQAAGIWDRYQFLKIVYDYKEFNKLNDQEIRKLFFGKTSTGYVYGIKELEWVLDISNEEQVDFRYRGKSYKGKAWVENDNICLVREKYFDGLKSCEEIYRNPDGNKLTKTEYFRVTDYGYFLFSVEK